MSLRELVEEVAGTQSIRALHKGIELLCFIEDDVPDLLKGDSIRIMQILVNLVVNAIKFTDTGEVIINVMMSDSGEPPQREIQFSVTDTGIGIPQSHAESIFEKFSQVDSSSKRTFGGVGLGLSISKSLVELIGGRIWFESREGQGSTFSFTVPASLISENNTWTGRYDERFEGKLAMIVDGNKASRDILHRMISRLGFEVNVAPDAQAALQMLKGTDVMPDVLLLDHATRGMGTIDLIDQVKNDPGMSEIKIVLLSPLGAVNVEELKAGVIDDSIVKPIMSSKLTHVLTTLIKGGVDEESTDPVNGVAAGNESSQSSGGSNRHKARVLVVDDTDDNRKLAKRMLELGGYEVDLAGSAKEGIAAVYWSSYDLILMDIQMPVMDGFEATKAIRTWESSHGNGRTPIVALTAHAIMGYRESCMEGDMDDYITKPLRKQELLDMADKWVSENNAEFKSTNGVNTDAVQ